MKYLLDDFMMVTAAASSIASRVTQLAEDNTSGHIVLKESSEERYVRYGGKLVPWFEPITQLLNSKWASMQSPAAIASASSLAEGGWWPQDRLFESGLAADPWCRACGVKRGTLLHRLASCSARAELVEEQCPKWLARAASEMPADPLFSEGIPLRPVMPPPPPVQEHWIGAIPEDGAVASGEAYTDGALRGTIPKARRVGWAFVVRQGQAMVWGKYGVCSEPYASVLRAELRALAEILRITCGPLDVYVDNAQVVEGVQLGREWGVGSSREGADIWREIWSMLDELQGIRVIKVKAHLNYNQVQEGRIPFHHWCGNGVADTWAKSGCDAACASSSAEWPQRCWRRAQEWYRWVTVFAANWTGDIAMSGPVQKRPSSVRVHPIGGPKEKTHLRRHELWTNKKTWWCRLCGSRAWHHGLHEPPASFRKPCRGTLADRCRVEKTGRHDDPLSYDDGAISLSFLHAQFAVRAYAMEEVQHVTSESLRQDELQQEVTGGVEEPCDTDRYPPSLASESEDDPFGHLQRGMDDLCHYVSDHATGHGSSNAAEEVSSATVVLDTPNTNVGSFPLDPAAEGSQEPTETPGQAHGSHNLRRGANMVWCADCGRSAISRIGIGLQRPCRGMAIGAYPACIERMKAGRHPITGRQMRVEDSAQFLPDLCNNLL